MKLLSVVVPVYNVEPYLHECIDSILNQTYSNLEIILVDDGSTDKSGSICDEYALQDSRIQVIHQKNGGLSAARNTGITIASGQYIAFVDSDDFLDINMYSVLVDTLEKNHLDIVECNAYRYKSKNKIKAYKNDGELIIYNHDEAIGMALEDSFASVWNKVYKFNLFKNIKFPEGRKYEDTATTYLIINKITNMGHIDHCLYYYRLNPNSITQTSFDAKSRWDFVLGYIERLEFAEKNSIGNLTICKGLLVKSCLSCLTAYYGNPTYDTKKNYNQCVHILTKYKNNDMYNILSMKYKLLLYCFNKYDFIHKIYGKFSYFIKHKKF